MIEALANDCAHWSASKDTTAHGPQRIVCLTEEFTEWLYMLVKSAASRRHPVTP
jgi:hypothetical protein